MRDVNLRLNKKNLQFFKHETEYLGHIVPEKGISIDAEKIEAVINCPTPTKKRMLEFSLVFVLIIEDI